VDVRLGPIDSERTARPVVLAAPQPEYSEDYLPGNEVMASRTVLNDLLHLAEILQNEARNLDVDTAEFWSQWRAVMPVPQLGASAAEEGRRNEVFALMNAGRLQNTRSHLLIERLRKAEAQWWRIWRFSDAEATARRDGLSVRPQLDKFKAHLETLAGESNALDAGIRLVQGQYDFTRSLSLDLLTSARPGNPVLRQPWHWNYALSGIPRPDMTYDYATRYAEHYDESIESLRSGGRKAVKRWRNE